MGTYGIGPLKNEIPQWSGRNGMELQMHSTDALDVRKMPQAGLEPKHYLTEPKDFGPCREIRRGRRVYIRYDWPQTQ